MKTIQVTHTSDDRYYCEVEISSHEWLVLLRNDEIKDKTYITTLARFMREPGHKAFCASLGRKYGSSPQTFNASVTNFCKWVQKSLNRFKLVDLDGEDTFWAIAMNGQRIDGLFEWTLKPELVDALRIRLVELLVDNYRDAVLPRGLKAEDANELYKWEILSQAAKMTDVEIAEAIKGRNIVDIPRVQPCINYLLKENQDDLKAAVSALRNDDASLDSRLSDFKKIMSDALPHEYKVKANDERTAAAFLACINPQEYTFYKDEIYSDFCLYLGTDIHEAGKKYSHYLELLQRIVSVEKEDANIQAFLKEETSSLVWSDLLNAQDVLWQMKEYLKEQVATCKQFTWIPFYKEVADRLLDFKKNRKELLDIIYGLGEEHTGYLHENDKSKLSDICPFTVMGCFNRSGDAKRIQIITFLKERLGIVAPIPEDFIGIPTLNAQMSMFFWGNRKDTDIDILWDTFEAAVKGDSFEEDFDKAKEVQGAKWNLTMGMYWARPDQYLTLDSRTQAYLKNEYGVDIPKISDFSGAAYKSLLDNIRDKMVIGEIKEQSFYELSYGAWNYDMNDRKYWLVGFNYGGDISQFDRFIEGRYWDGSGTDAVNKRIESIKAGDILILKTSFTKGSEHKTPSLRIAKIAVATSDSMLMDGGNYRVNARYLDIDPKDFDGKTYGQYRQTAHACTDKAIIKYVNQYLNIDTPQTYINMGTAKPKMSNEARLLLNVKNLILTGAPGTGKTFLAKAIAKELGAEGECVKMVQFHPSYDYTDFVEGLRPTEDGRFIRMDGAFKAFCKKALKNIEDANKGQAAYQKDVTIKTQTADFLSDAIDNETEFKTKTGNKFKVVAVNDNNVTVAIPENDKVDHVTVLLSEIYTVLASDLSLDAVKEIRELFGRRFGSQQDSYTFSICKQIRKYDTLPSLPVGAVKKQNYVFIIDEINRGEISKIFGELFYSIDPGYRSDSLIRINTQYQNMVPSTDPFAEGFFVPENVFLIGTMNDIDRSVESMDFAIRRRFAWKEIKPDDHTEMWNGSIDEWKEEASARMSGLNKSIADPSLGLGEEYGIGPAYFLKLKDYRGDFKALWDNHIEGVLKEYLRGNPHAKESLKKLRDAYDLIKVDVQGETN